jgi:RNA polymerase sigma factor (sigma-70 family)
MEWLDSPYLRRLVVRVAHLYGLRPEEIPDVLQETRIALWKAGATACVPAAWIFETAGHKAADLLRLRIRSRTHERAVFRSILPQRSPDPELEHLLHARVELLPSDLREFYWLKYKLGLSEREIARRRGICRASVRWLDRRCRRALKASL